MEEELIRARTEAAALVGDDPSNDPLITPYNKNIPLLTGKFWGHFTGPCSDPAGAARGPPLLHIDRHFVPYHVNTDTRVQ